MKILFKNRLFLIIALMSLTLSLIVGCSSTTKEPENNNNSTSQSESQPESQAKKSLFEGKQVTVDVANAAGGGNDAVARIVASFIPKYSGAKVTVTNTPGGGGVQAANMLSKTDPSKEPYTICLIGSGPILPQVKKQQGVVYDFNKIVWVGQVANLGVVLFTGADSPYKTINDLLNAKQFKEGSVGKGSIGEVQAQIRHSAIGWNSTIVSGYKKAGDIRMAAQQEEIDLASLAYTGVKSAVDEGQLRILSASGPVPAEVSAKAPPLSKVPEITSKLNSDQLGMLEFSENMAIGRSFAAPPGTSAEVKAEWGRILRQITEDPEFKSKLEGMGYVVEFNDADWLQNRIANLVDGLSKYKDLGN